MSDPYKPRLGLPGYVACMDASIGPVFQPGQPGYDDDRLGLNRAATSKPAYVVGAAGDQDVVAAVRPAAEQKWAVGVLATGHGPAALAGDAVLVNTRRMDGVGVDVARATAWIQAGRAGGRCLSTPPRAGWPR
jgi:hypothetical protein